MFGLKRFFKKLFNDDNQNVGQDLSSDSVRKNFTNRYLNFKTLLSTNNEVLELINDMESAFSGSRTFGMSFIRANCTAISVNIYKIINCLNEISNYKYKELSGSLEGILPKINSELQQKKIDTSGELVLSLEGINKTMVDHVGAKMANLGEVKNAVGLSVPDGFAITAAAYEYFLEYCSLQDEINRQIQFLEPADIAMLHKSSSYIQNLIINAACPPELEDAIIRAYTDLTKKTGDDNLRVSMRSSALGEDTRDASFAGQYRSVLNVSRENLILSYKEIIASKYSVPAISYRLSKGFRDEDIIMSVGCMSMVDAAAGGVIYSADPGNICHQCIIINAVWGLGKSVVDGSMVPDFFILSRKDPKIILKKEISTKGKQLVSSISEGISLADVAIEKAGNPAITDEQSALLGELALRLEKHFGDPQDIEWVIEPDGSVMILQSRPLMVLGEKITGLQNFPELKVDSAAVILRNGVTASPGVASGPAFVVETTVDMLQFPPGAVLVTKNPLPQWAALLSSAAAVVTDRGGVTGHMAAVAREFNVPAFLGTSTATRLIHNGDVVTVDATGCRVYTGRIESLLEKASKKTSLMKGSPVHKTLGNVLKYIAPLNLTDPDAPNFKIEGCRTIHDIIRFAHEMSLPELFGFKKNGSFPEHLAKRLVINVPMQWWVIDLSDGCKEGIKGDTIGLEDITSEPMLTLWEGINAIPWQGPPPIDTKGFFSVMYGATLDRSLVPSMHSRYNDRNYLMISKNFCHLSSRFGFHFSTVEAFWGDKVAENYICFNFNGGAADEARRARRAKLIKLVLEKFDFWVKIKGDTLFARIERQEVPFLKERLKVLGHLVMHTRQLDMVLSNSGRVDKYLEKILKELSSFVDVPE